MKRTLIASLAVLGTLLPLAAPAAETSDSELLALRKSVWVAWFAYDRPALEAVLPENALYMSNETSPWHTRAETLDAAKRFHDSGGKLLRLDFPKTEIRRYGDLVLMYTTYVFEAESGGKKIGEEGKGVEVFVKKDGRWLHPAWCIGLTKPVAEK
jgi:hypothetical protein